MRRGPTVQVGRGGPGLLGTMAKTAVIAGTATVTAKAVSGAMGGGSAQKQEDRQEFGRGGTAVRYKMRDKIMSIGDDFWIENEQRQRVYKVDGKMLRIRDILKFEDAQGNVLSTWPQSLSSCATRSS